MAHHLKKDETALDRTWKDETALGSKTAAKPQPL